MLTRSQFSLGVILVLVSSLGANGVAQAQTQLLWKFVPGETLKHNIEQEMIITMTVADQEVESTVNQHVEGEWTFGKVGSNGNADLTQTISRIQMKMSGSMGLGFEIDSGSDEAPEGIGAVIAPAIKAMAKSKINLTMTPRGEIVDARISKETEEALKALPGVGQIFNKDTLANMVKQGAPPLPMDKVKVGDSWSHKMDVELPQIGKMGTTTNLIYRGKKQVEGKTLDAIDLTMETTIGASTNPLLKMSIKDQSASGKMYFDSATGRLSHSEIVQVMTMEISAGGTNTEQKIQQTIKMALIPTQ